MLDLAQDSDFNLVTRNVIHVGTARGPLGIGANCGGNSVYGNVVQP